MKRRDFIKRAGLATAGAFAVPYILPSGRLFAASGIRRVNHVVFCLFAGGVRNLEAVDKAEGNLMRAMLNGSEILSSDIAATIDPIPNSPLPYRLQTKGTLFTEFRYASGPTGHFNGHTTAITGRNTTSDLSIKDHPTSPTIFELYRRHNSPEQSALNCWWVSNNLGPYPALNYSSYAGYGAKYGANFIAPTFMFNQQGYDSIGTLRTFTSAEEAAINNMRTFMNNNFNKSFVDGDAGVSNPVADAGDLQSWMNSMFDRYSQGQFLNPWNYGSMNNDMYNIFFAEEIIKKYKPELMVVNMQDVDIAHFDFTNYCNNLRKADYSVAHLWNTIQNDPVMADDTVMIIAPEHGRNEVGNSSVDINGRNALDHTANLDGTSGDQMAREVFCLVVGPPAVVKQGITLNNGGECTDIASAISYLLGFDSQMPAGILERDFANTGIKNAFNL